MSEIKEKLEKFLKNNNMNVPEFSSKSKVGAQVIYNTLKGKTKPRAITIKEIEEFIGKFENKDVIDIENKDKNPQDDPFGMEKLKEIIGEYKKSIADRLNIDQSKVDIKISL